MEIQIIIMSIITYLLLFNGCLNFRLTILQNIIVTAVIAIHVVFVNHLIGGFFVIPMFIILILYIAWLKPEDWQINVFLIVMAYIILVILDNLTHLIWNMVGLDISKHWLIYMIVDYPIFWFICRFLSNRMVSLRKNKSLVLSPKILTLIGADIALCMIICVVHINVAEQAGSTSPILLSSILLYIGYVILTFLMVITIVKEYDKNAQTALKQNSYDNLQEYISQIEILYQNLRSFKHDYANIMLSMSGFIDNNDPEGLKKYYEEQIFPMSDHLIKTNDAIAALRNLDIMELKSLIFVKLNYALELNIEVHVEIVEKIEAINMESIDLVRITGILLDNAIEACQECEKPSICFSIIKTNQDVTLIIKNTYVKRDIDYSKLGNIGVSSKGEGRGSGLHNIKNIISAYDNVIMDTEYGTEYFTQVLEIYGE